MAYTSQRHLEFSDAATTDSGLGLESQRDDDGSDNFVDAEETQPDSADKVEQSPTAAETQNITASGDASYQSKFRILLGVLKKFIGVKDIVALRISLPAQLLEPVGNLEYWNYNDRPDFLAVIGDSDDALERMFATIRWWFSKDLKHVKGKLCKPYNSILGEQFFCHWDVEEPEFTPDGDVINRTGTSKKTLRVKCINEQISHHPPVSAFYYHCPEKNVSAKGVDHISARFTGTTVKIGPGEQNKGIYINLHDRDEEYLLTHPIAGIQGWLKGNLYITVTEACIITCPKTKLKTILEYKEEKWLGKPKFAIEGKIIRYDPENDTVTKLKHVSDDDIVATVTGSWRGQVQVTRHDTRQTRVILDMEKVDVIPKMVKPLEEQDEMETRKVWHEVTESLLAKDYSKATKCKQAIEERQRQLVKHREKNNEPFESKYFITPIIDGRPVLKGAADEKLKY